MKEPRLLGLLLALATTACSQGQAPTGRATQPTPQNSAKTLPSVLIEGVPHVQQKPDFCGEAASESWLSALGVPVDQDREAKPADYAQHVHALRPRVPPGFHVLVAEPFVVLGDDSEARVRASAEQVVGWAVERLERDFFARAPSRILDIWLFKDEESYARNTRALFGKPPSTPFGYYSSEDGALVMNIATGGGTLVHEIVHPFIEANFPNSPAWFNEGLGSLFEQSADRDGHIVGLTNWRLAGLQRAIRRKQLPSLRALMASTSQQFYGKDSGNNYAQARYLLYYLQEKGLLGAYYREFTARQAQDPTGFQSLKRVLAEDDAAGFQERWQAFVLGLHFP